MATGEDPTSVAIASIQSAATFPDPNVKYVFRTENGGQVREGPGCRCCYLGLGLREVHEHKGAVAWRMRGNCTVGSLEAGVGLGVLKSGVWGAVAESVSERLLGLYMYKYRGCSERAYGSGYLLLSCPSSPSSCF